MKEQDKPTKQSLIVCRLFLALATSFGKYALARDDYGSQADNAILVAAIFIGQAEGRPMTVAKLANYIGMPRPTVDRKLKAMWAAGLLDVREEKYTLRKRNEAETEEGIAETWRNVRRIINSGKELSILDK